MDAKEAGSSLNSLISSFNDRITELQELVIGRNMYPETSVADLSAVDSALKSMEMQVQAIKDRLREETEAVPKAKKLIEASLKQQKKLQSMSPYAPVHFHESTAMLNSDINRSLLRETIKRQEDHHSFSSLKQDPEPAVSSKEKKGSASPPLWYITSEDLDSLSSYMRGRLTLEKVNAAINDMAAYAQANAKLIAAPRMKVADSSWERALEIRDIATTESVKGKHFFLESDMKGPVLKFDNTGKAIMTVLRHLGRISETRVGHHRVILLMKPQ